MANHLPRSTLLLKEPLQPVRGHHDEHQGVHKGTPGGNLLRSLTFAISWGGILLVVGPGGFPGTPEQFETLLPLVGLAMLAGPPVAGILLTGLVHGRAGLREFLSRLLRWRVGPRWYAVALLTAPLLMLTVTPLALSLLFPTSSPAYSHPPTRLHSCCSVSPWGLWPVFLRS